MNKGKSILSAMLVAGMMMSSTVYAAPYNGWKNKSYYVNGMKVKGLYAVKDHYYYFGTNGVMKTGKQKIKGNTYFLDDQGIMQMRKKRGVYYNSHNQPIDPLDGYEYETIEKAKAIANKITTKKMRKSEKLLKCFKWVQHFHYKTTHVF